MEKKLELNGPSMMSTHIRLVANLKPSLSVSRWPFFFASSEHVNLIR